VENRGKKKTQRSKRDQLEKRGIGGKSNSLTRAKEGVRKRGMFSKGCGKRKLPPEKVSGKGHLPQKQKNGVFLKDSTR